MIEKCLNAKNLPKKGVKCNASARKILDVADLVFIQTNLLESYKEHH